MKNAIKLSALLAAAMIFSTILPVRAAQPDTVSGEAAVEIYTYEELLKIAEEPAGSYRLMDNIDLEGLAWEPVDFSGVFDGNGYSLLNMEVTGTSAGVEDTYDGNYKVYDTHFAGMFGTLKNAEVKDLHLVNVKVRVETDLPCFIGSIAGYSADSTISGCSVLGRLELSAHDRMFGVGGIVGYGNGLIEQTEADVTLICIDTDAETRDEQFMGGAYAAGHMDLNGCSVKIDGYDSDHGYVHNGGLVGMYIFYPAGLQYQGRITNNSVSGMITFFEDNTNRRAYCKEYVGEIMNWDFTNGPNSADFVRNEVYDYSVDLRPDMCVDAAHTETVTEPGCDTFGYTAISCDNCGYTYTDHYTLYRHSVTEWQTVKEPTVAETGLKQGSCELCGKVFEEELAKLDPPEPEETPEASSSEAEQPEAIAAVAYAEPSALEKAGAIVVAGAIAAAVAVLIFGGIVIMKSRRR